VGLQLDLPVGEGHKSGVRRTNLVLLPPALALCPDLARGENQNVHFNGQQRLFDCCWLLMSCVDALMRENFSGSRAVLLASAKICHNDERSVGTNKSSIVGNNTFT